MFPCIDIRGTAFFLPLQVKFREFILSILNVSRQCLASSEEDVAVIAFEIFDEMIESPAPLLGGFYWIHCASLSHSFLQP